MTDSEKLSQWLDQLDHPMKPELELLRQTVRAAHPPIAERIKWNAPSYYTHADLFTFNLSNKKEIRLVFHHPSIVQVASPILEGDWKDRRIAYFRSAAEVQERLPELDRVVREAVRVACP
jgi:hypothetical protein